MDFKKNITGIPMLMALQFAKPYIESGKLKFGDELNIHEIISANENMGGNMHMMIAMILEKITGLNTCNIGVKLSSTDFMEIQTLIGDTNTKLMALEELPSCEIKALVEISNQSSIKVSFSVTSLNEDELPSMEFSFGFRSGGVGSWIDMAKFQMNKGKIEKMVKSFLVKKAMDNWVPDEDLSNFANLSEGDQEETRKRIGKAYQEFHQSTLEKFEKFDLNEMIENIKKALNDMLKPIESLDTLFDFKVGIQIFISNELNVSIDYQRI